MLTANTVHLKNKVLAFSDEISTRTELDKLLRIKISARYEIFHKQYVLGDFSSQEKLWMDMTSSIQVTILIL